MHKLENQIRDLELIEKELNANPVGVIALMLDSETVSQMATTFIYLDKNIFIFFGNDNEIFQRIQLNSKVIFTIIKYGNNKKGDDLDFDPTYNLFYISISGLIKKIDDQKIIEELQKKFLEKYKRQANEKTDLTILTNVIMIDTEEIQAFEETGG